MFLLLIIACAAATVVSGIDWGLPTKADDDYLFASHPVWTGEELAAFDPDRKSRELGADVDRDPVNAAETPAVISRSDSQRAEIIRRFRLYSHQPDEMITFMALQQMEPSKLELDPRLYQYGGVWIYPVGAMLKSAGAARLIELRPDSAFYYENPEAFGRFYIVARVYTVFWLVVLLGCVATIARKITHSDAAAVAATALAALTPVVFAMAHEAKPHLGGVALTLLACIFAGRWVERGRRRDAISAGAAVGLAAGIVLSAAVSVAVLPTMILLRRIPWTQRLVVLLLTGMVAIGAYAITNPYVIIHLATDASALKSNLDNSQKMYEPGDAAAMALGGGMRFVEAASIPLLAIGAVAVFVLIVRRRPMSPIAAVLLVLCGLVTLQFFLLAANKPSEYARFAMLPTVGIALGAIWVISLIPWRSLRIACFVVTPLAVAALATLPYFQAFLADTRPGHTRHVVAERLDDSQLKGSDTIQIFAAPGPYNMPPVDPWRWRILLSKPGDKLIGDIVLRPVDYAPTDAPPAEYRREYFGGSHRPAPITWADKPFDVLMRESKR